MLRGIPLISRDTKSILLSFRRPIATRIASLLKAARRNARTSEGSGRPDGCGVPPLRRSAFARLCVPPCSRTDRTPCQHPEGMDHPASVLFLLQMTRHLVAAREQGAAAAAGP